jgi:parallel beta-helix repeat protein
MRPISVSLVVPLLAIGCSQPNPVQPGPVSTNVPGASASNIPDHSASQSSTPGMANGASDLCGTTIVADMILNQSFRCAGQGLTVGANNITLRLNGNTISGSSSGVGISLTGRSGVRITGPGIITGFRTGILVVDSLDIEIDDVSALENGVPRPPTDELAALHDGILVINSHRVELEGNVTVRNGDDGINLISSSESQLSNNMSEDNGHNGLRLDASDYNRLRMNRVLSNGDLVGFPRGCGIEVFGSINNVIEENVVIENHTGIRLRALAMPARASTGNVIEENVVSRSEGPDADRGGIHLRDSSTRENRVEDNRVTESVHGIALSGSPVRNTFAENTLVGNACGFKGPVDENTVGENQFVSNRNDFCS